MKIEYFDLLSPEPYEIKDVGSITSPTLKKIKQHGFAEYNLYLTFLLMDITTYFEKIETKSLDWYKKLNDKDKSTLALYDFIICNEMFISTLVIAFNFFFTDTVVFDKYSGTFILSKELIDNPENEISCTGIIHRDNYTEVCNAILQFNGIDRSLGDEDLSKAKNDRAKHILAKIKRGSAAQLKSKKADKRMELGNIISKLSCRHNSINILNIWDMTVFQVKDQFRAQQNNNIYNIKSTSISVWGDKENTFDISSWLET